jgi:sulfhydrogenase subunit delta
MSGKAKVGFYGVTGCAGCLLSVAFNEDEILDIVGAIDLVAFPFIKGENDNECKLDIVFIEGTVASKDDEVQVKKLRKRASIVVALGACACVGNIPALRNYKNEKDVKDLKYDKREQNQDRDGGPRPLHEVIPVEFSLPGCPPDRDEIKTFIKEVLLGKTFKNYKDPVCIECKLNDNGCLLDEGEVCVGPITAGGCKAICTTNGLKCYGCRGLTDDANFEEFFALMEEKGIDATATKKVMETFMAIDINEKLKDTKWAKLH